MNPQQFARLKRILLQAAKLPESERADFVAEACADDAELLAKAQSLLDSDRALPEVLKTGGIGELLEGTEISPTDSDSVGDLPQEIGGFKIKSVLGRGGMGIVYEAEQRSPPRPVALKVIRTGSYVSEQHIRLFRREQLALAQLSHPGIASIYEAGRTDDGEHFFAMELVRGKRLDDYLSARSVSGEPVQAELNTRLRIFLQICHAINYAHQRGVIHRDLKPSNIVVHETEGVGGDTSSAPGPRVKILDFGIAKITESDVTLTTMATGAGKILGTLNYMSPEQALGDQHGIDFRSDVYSLGVILYEMLTDRHPYDIRDTSIPRAIQMICDEAPSRPSVALRTLRGDLETIILKALEKAPDRRYQSALAMADDIERFLTSQPILARPPSAAYQFRKLVNRHRAPFALVVALFVLLVAFGITMSVMFTEQRREHARADAEAGKATQISGFLQDMFESLDPRLKGRDVKVSEVLDGAEERIAGLSDQPDIQAEVQIAIGGAYSAVGEKEKQLKHLREALETRRRILPPRHPDIAESLYGLISALRGRDGRSDFQEMEDLLPEAISIHEELYGEKDARVGFLYGNQGYSKYFLNYGRPEREEAAALIRKSVEILEAVSPPGDPTLLRSKRWLGIILFTFNENDEAERLFREAVEESQRHNGEYDSATAHSLRYLGSFLRYRKRFEEAAEAHRAALAIFRSIYGEDHPNSLDELRNLILAVRSDKPEAAEPLAREYVERVQRVLPSGDFERGSAHLVLGDVLIKLNRFEEAEPHIIQANEIIQPSSDSSLTYKRWALWVATRVYEGLGDEEQRLHWQSRLDEFNAQHEDMP